MIKTESGRSMVEMLGVLAIIGVLSVGGIAGYTMAMNKYRANEALNAASLVAVEGMAQGKDISYKTDIASDLPTSIKQYVTAIQYTHSTDTVKITCTDASKEPCTTIAKTTKIGETTLSVS